MPRGAVEITASSLLLSPSLRVYFMRCPGGSREASGDCSSAQRCLGTETLGASCVAARRCTARRLRACTCGQIDCLRAERALNTASGRGPLSQTAVDYPVTVTLQLGTFLSALLLILAENVQPQAPLLFVPHRSGKQHLQKLKAHSLFKRKCFL